jgi:phosphate transport system protein
MIALMQPVAGDMRFIITAMKLTTDLERMGDKAEKIAKKTIELSREEPLELDIDIAGISKLVQAMLADSINSFIKRDAGLAREVIKNDDKVDELTDQAIEKLLSAMSSNPTITKRGIKMYSIIRSLERMADHSTNISEMVIYLIEGDIIRHSAEPKKAE